MPLDFVQVESQQATGDGGLARLRVKLADGRELHFLATTISVLRAETAAVGWCAWPDMVVVSALEGSDWHKILSEVLPIWQQYRARHKEAAAGSSVRPEYKIEYYGQPESCATNGWCDIAVHFEDGATYTLTVETPSSIEADLADDGGAFFCPDLLVVREIDRDLIFRAIAHVVARGIAAFGVRAHSPGD